MTFFTRPVLAAAMLASLASLVAGCGGGKPRPSVASLGTTTTGGTGTTADTPSGSQSTGGGGAAPAGGGGGRMVMAGGSVQQLTKFAACMRKNGVPNFPDPNAQGQISVSGIDPGSAAFQHARQACQKELPNGGQPTPAQQAQARRQALAFSACMRKNGVPKFPDPQFGSGGRVGVHIGPSAGIDPQSPQFKHAQQVCQKDLPLGKAPPTAKAGG